MVEPEPEPVLRTGFGQKVPAPAPQHWRNLSEMTFDQDERSEEAVPGGPRATARHRGYTGEQHGQGKTGLKLRKYIKFCRCCEMFLQIRNILLHFLPLLS